MAAPTSVRVESTSQNTATTRWVYAGAALISVYRSPDGITYAEVTVPNTRVAIGTLVYVDVDLVAGTKYWYKLSDNVGSTFSSVVTVITHACTPRAPSGSDLSLPRFNDVGATNTLKGELPPGLNAASAFTGDELNTTGPYIESNNVIQPREEMPHHQPIDPQTLDDAMQQIESVVSDTVLGRQDCQACVEDGAIVFDCATGCSEFETVVSEDVNSITIQRCDDKDISVNWIVPTGTFGIGGWPNGQGYSGDEAFRAKVTGPRTLRTPLGKSGGGPKSKPGMPRRSTSGGSPGAGSCACIPGSQNQLTIKSCTASNSLSCSTTKSLQLKACGGQAPYNWSKTGAVVLSASIGVTITVTPPVNTGSGTHAGAAAYWVDGLTCNGANCSGSVCSAVGVIARGEYGCDDTWLSALPGYPSPCDRVTNCGGYPAASTFNVCCSGSTQICDNSNPCVDARYVTNAVTKVMCDKRDAGMIADGCAPCGLNAGATVSVTDALGVVATIILTS